MERRSGLEKPVGEKCFQLGKARDAWRETMLDVRLNGEAFALPYAHLSLVKLEGESALTLSFSTHLVKIEGERLRPLYDALLDHAVRHVIAASAQTRERVPANEPLITSLDIVPLGQADPGML